MTNCLYSFLLLLFINAINSARSSIPPLLLDFIKSPSEASPEYFNQNLDHFDPSNTKTFKQRYFVNSQYYQTGGPVFLYVSGENELSPTSISTGLPDTLAKTYNGTVFGLEHRYYGDSHPFSSLTKENMAYLSSAQALSDLVTFIQSIPNPSTGKPFDTRTKWITIGGSYAGALSAWARMQYPNMIFGALASSAPLKVKDDFFEYDLHVQKAIGPDCFPLVKQVSDQVESIILSKNNERINNLKSMLSCTEIGDPLLLLYTFSDLVSNLVQYSNPSIPNNIQSMCAGFKNHTSSEDRLEYFSEVFKKELKKMNKSCYEFTSYDSLISLVPSKGNSFRQWTYQSCNEFGYWQTAPHGPGQKALRSSLLTKEWFQEFYCGPKIFGSKVGPSITNQILQRYIQNGTIPEIIFTNGEMDPWSALSVTTVPRPGLDQPVYIIKGGSHVTDIGPSYPQDSESLKEVRNSIIQDIGRWLLQNRH